MLFEVTGDLVADKQYTIFCHQTNCCGRMRSGIAKQIAETYPTVPARDKKYHDAHADDEVAKKILGTTLWSRTDDGRLCVNMYAQERYGRDKCQTDYVAFAKCLFDIAATLNNAEEQIPEDTKIGFPDHIGCGLAGGDWDTIIGLINAFSKAIKQDVYIVRLP